MATQQGGNGLDFRMKNGGPSISMRGSMVVLVVIMLAVAGGLGYLIDIMQKGMTKQHAAIVHGQDRLSCVVSLTTEERVKFRNEWKPGAYERWCPWMTEEQGGSK